MRLNTRNLIGIVAVLLVMGAMLYLGTRPDMDEATETPEAADVSGPLFADLDEEAVDRFEVRRLPDLTAADEAEGDEEAAPIEPPYVVMTRDEEALWHIDEATHSTDREADQMMVTGSASLMAGLSYAEQFASDDIGTFGLDAPQAEIVLGAGEDAVTLRIGDKNPGGTRYYVQLADDTEAVYMVVSDIIDNVLAYADTPPYVPAPTATPTPFPTANPYSEVEQTATAQVELDMTATAEAIPTATPTPEPVGPQPDNETDDEG